MREEIARKTHALMAKACQSVRTEFNYFQTLFLYLKCSPLSVCDFKLKRNKFNFNFHTDKLNNLFVDFSFFECQRIKLTQNEENLSSSTACKQDDDGKNS